MPQIDLSAGLQPKPNVDLSAGFVPQDGPTISALPSKQAKPGFFGSVSQENTGESNPLHLLGVNLPEQAGKILQHPLRALGIGAKSDYEGVTDAAKGEYDAMKDSAIEGHYGDAAAHFLHYLGSPLFGTAPHRAAEKFNVGDIRGGLGTTVGATLPFLMNPAGAEGIQAIGHEASSVVKGAADLSKEGVSQVKQAINPVKNMTAEQAAIKAVRPRNSKANFPQELSTALPDTRRALDKAGVDASNMTLQDAMDAAHQAKKDVWAELKANHPNANLSADTTPTADSMRSTVSNRMRTQNPALAKRIERAASEYDGASMSLDEIEDRVKELNNQTRAIEARYVTDKAAAKQSPKNAYLFAERDALKNLLLSKLDEATGPGAANLRKRYGNLTSFQDVVSRRIPVAERQAPVTLPGLIGKVYGPAKIAAGTGKLLVGNPGGLHDIFEGTVAMKGARDAARLNDPDTLISHAFSKTQPTPQPQLSGPTLPFLPSPAPQVPATTGPAFLRNLAQQSESLERNPALDKVLSKSGFTPKGYAPEEYNFNGERMYEFQGPTGSEVILPESQITPERLKTTFSPESDLEQVRRGAPTPPVEVPAVNQVPKEQRASNQIVNEAQEKAAGRIEGRTEQKKALEEPKAQAAAVGSSEPKIVGYAAHDHKPIIEIQPQEQKPAEAPKPDQPAYGESNKLVTKDDYEKAKKAFNDKTQKLSSGFDPTALSDIAKIGAYHFEAGAREFAAWSQKMIQEVGEQVRPHLQNIWDAIRAEHNQPDAPTFYSKALQVAQDKLPNSVPSQQVKPTLLNNGVKAEELKHMGLDEFLNGKTKVSKQELLDHMRQNSIQVGEVEKSEKTIPDMPWLKTKSGYGKEMWVTNVGRTDYAVIKTGNEFGLHRDSSFLGDFDSLEEAQRAAHTDAAGKGRNSPKFGQYQLPGGKNYRELLITLPEKERAPATIIPSRDHPGQFEVDGESGLGYFSTRERAQEAASKYSADSGTFRGGHFDEPNVLAHVRFNDHVSPDGKKTLFIEELQSDWHQKGRKQGYADSGRIAELEHEMEQLRAKSRQHPEGLLIADPGASERVARVSDELNRLRKSQVPDAPFKSTWHELALKRILRYAAEKGYDRIAWTTGEQQAARYDLSKQVDEVYWQPNEHILTVKMPNGEIKQIAKDATPQKLVDYIGKEAAEKIVQPSAKDRSLSSEQDVHVLRNADLKVGGQGMKGFYDKIIPDFLNKYAKQWGARVGKTDIQLGEDEKALREAERSGNSEQMTDALGKKVKVHSLDVTPSMKKSVLKKGQPIAKSNPVLPWMAANA